MHKLTEKYRVLLIFPVLKLRALTIGVVSSHWEFQAGLMLIFSIDDIKPLYGFHITKLAVAAKLHTSFENF